jgi:hypothetical protein
MPAAVTKHWAKREPAQRKALLATLRRIVRYRIKQINQSYPKSSGEFKEFYDNGWLKAKGCPYKTTEF